MFDRRVLCACLSFLILKKEKPRFIGEVRDLRHCGRKNKSNATSFTL